MRRILAAIVRCVLAPLSVSLLVITPAFGNPASLQDVGAAGIVFSDGGSIRYCSSGVSNCASATVLTSAGNWGVPRLSPDGTKLAYGDVDSADVADFNQATGLSNITSLDSGVGTNGAYSIAWSSDSQTIYTYEPEGGTRQHVIETYSRSGGTRTGTLSVPAGSGNSNYRLILGDPHPDTARIVVVAGNSTGRSTAPDTNNWPWPSALAADGTIYFLNASGEWDPAAPTLVGTDASNQSNNVNVRVGGDHGVWAPNGDFYFSAGDDLTNSTSVSATFGALYMYRQETNKLYRLTGQKTYRGDGTNQRNDSTRWAFKDPSITPDESGITFLYRRGYAGANTTADDLNLRLGYVSFAALTNLIDSQDPGSYGCVDYVCGYTTFLKMSDITEVAKLGTVAYGYDLVPTTYSVTYNGNGSTGGSVPTDATPYDAGDDATASDNSGSLTRTGYIFQGWNTAADGTGSDRATGSTFTMPSSDVTLYAQWTAESYTVSFDSNGGSGSASDASVTFGSAASLPTSTAFTRSGYTFSGWNTAADGTGTQYSNGDTWTTDLGANGATDTLYAKWIAESYTVSFDANGGSGSASDASVTFGSAASLPTSSAFTRSGYAFSGWNTAAGGTGTQYSNGDTWTTDLGANGVTDTLYAVWTPLPFLNSSNEFPDAPLNECQYIESDGTVSAANSTVDLVGESISCGEATNIEIDLEGNEPDATTVEDGQLLFFSGREGVASGFGFKANTQAEVWIASTPQYLGTVTVASDGTWTKVFDVPSDIPDGEHTIQAEGIAASGANRAVNAGVLIRSAPTAPTAPTGPALAVPGLGGLATLILAGLLGIIGLVGRRRVTPAH